MALVMKRRDKRSRRKNVKKDPVGEYASDAWSLAKRTAIGLNEIRKLINIETKFFDYAVNTTYTTTSVNHLTNMAQGLTSTTRVGDSIKLQHIEFSASVVTNVASAGARVRITLVRDLMCQGTVFIGSDLYQDTSSQPATIVSAFKFNEKDRFSILYDEVLTVCNGTFAQSSYYSAPHAGHVKYLGTTATNPSIGNGALFIAITCSEAANVPTVSAYCRVMYTDD
jgi:hypothetical protein